MKSYREECNKAKQEKRTKTPEEEIRGKRGKGKDSGKFVLEYRFIAKQIDSMFWTNEWTKWRSYRTLGQLEEAMAKLKRNHSESYEWRIKRD